MKRLNMLKRGGGKMTYTFLFYRHIMFRHSCGKCHFCNTMRPSDITLADFWGWEKVVPDFNDDDKGCSLVIVNTPKGQELFESAKARLNAIPVELERCLQPNLMHPSEIHPLRMKFENDYIKKGFPYIMYKYGDISLRYRLVKQGKRVLYKILRVLNIK